MAPELRQTIEQAGDRPVEITDPQTQTARYLVRADVFRELRELLEEGEQRRVIAGIARRNADARMDEP
jgi:hypothetical protein